MSTSEPSETPPVTTTPAPPRNYDTNKWDIEGIDASTAHKDEISAFIRWEIAEYAKDRWRDDDLWEMFHDDFRTFTQEHFAQTSQSAIRTLRNQLRESGVYAVAKRGAPIAKALCTVLGEEQLTNGRFNSYLLNLPRYQHLKSFRPPPPVSETFTSPTPSYQRPSLSLQPHVSQSTAHQENASQHSVEINSAANSSSSLPQKPGISEDLPNPDKEMVSQMALEVIDTMVSPDEFVPALPANCRKTGSDPPALQVCLAKGAFIPNVEVPRVPNFTHGWKGPTFLGFDDKTRRSQLPIGPTNFRKRPQDLRTTIDRNDRRPDSQQEPPSPEEPCRQQCH